MILKGVMTIELTDANTGGGGNGYGGEHDYRVRQ